MPFITFVKVDSAVVGLVF